MIEHYRATLNEIQKEAEDEFPNRRIILKKAFNAHRHGDYELSIPVMLAQADGIGEEIFGKDISPSSQQPRKGSMHEKSLLKTKLTLQQRKCLGITIF
jgi:hypothetical protein